MDSQTLMFSTLALLRGRRDLFLTPVLTMQKDEMCNILALLLLAIFRISAAGHMMPTLNI